MEHTANSTVKEIDTIKWFVVERILLAFYDGGSLKRSQITLKSGLKYNNCMRYLKWLNEKMEFVAFELDHHKQIVYIHLTPQGISFCKNKILENENVKTSEEHLFV
jgi:hypothetical protein